MTSIICGCKHLRKGKNTYYSFGTYICFWNISLPSEMLVTSWILEKFWFIKILRYK
jgi:hypothetical protein